MVGPSGLWRGASREPFGRNLLSWRPWLEPDTGTSPEALPRLEEKEGVSRASRPMGRSSRRRKNSAQLGECNHSCAEVSGGWIQSLLPAKIEEAPGEPLGSEPLGREREEETKTHWWHGLRLFA